MWWLWTSITFLLAGVGLVGTFLPALPGASLIFAAAVFHQLVTGGEHSVGWWTIAGLGILTLFSMLVDFLSGAAGAKWFGSGKWGLIGGIVGALVGIFFGIPGLLVGPLVGALVFELFAGKKLPEATKAGIGSFLGTTVGIGGKLIIAIAMVIWLGIALFV